MCVAIIGTIVGAGVSLLQAGMAQQAKQAEYRAEAARWQQNVINSEAAARDEHRQIISRQLQEQEKTSQKLHISFIEEAQKGAEAEVQAAAGNVSGVSLNNILDDIASKSLNNRTYAERNYAFIVADTQEQLKASDTRVMSRINSIASPVEPINTFALDAAGIVAGAGTKIATQSGVNLGM